jgi:hypothetical protein
MDRREYLALVVREANRLVETHEPTLRAALEADGSLDACEAELERQLTPIIVEVEHPEDLIKHAALAAGGAEAGGTKLEPSLWQRAPSWESVRTRVALRCLGFDVKQFAVRLLRGAVPASPSGNVLDEPAPAAPPAPPGLPPAPPRSRASRSGGRKAAGGAP